ncbi:MAG TPA: malonyl-[acyl-carrier protein] O-methyltransferase BioC, partial [Pseudomonadales bacterium]|nr:malonyl-[acyl-carrier protein] O-methyltransferase BioC [Pseudomonadales bacterium]
RIIALARWYAVRVRVLTQRQHRPAYTDVRALARELRALGAHNLNAGRAAGLAGRDTWRRLQQAYAALADPDGSLPATWRVVSLVLERADD